MTKFYLFVRRYLTVLLVFGTLVSFAQQSVSGKVTAADDGSGIPGVNILEKGTSNGTVSDSDGNYRISVGANATLVFSFVGYTTQEVSVGSQSSVNVSRDKEGIGIELLSDAEGIVCKQYGVWQAKEVDGHKKFGVCRSTFVIDNTGTIRHALYNVNYKGHAAEVLRLVKALDA